MSYSIALTAYSRVRSRLARIAQKTDAKMACNTLLLSDHCDFSSKPELEIFADDVQCGHGATVIDIGPKTTCFT